MKIERLFLNINMGNSHDGLAKIALSFGCKVEKLTDQNVLLFLNRRHDKLKIIGHAGIVIGYLRMPKGERINLEAIQWLPQVFHERGQFDYDVALKKALSMALGKPERTPLSPLQAYRAAKAA